MRCWRDSAVSVNAPEEIGGFFQLSAGISGITDIPREPAWSNRVRGATARICTGSAERFHALVQTVRSWPEPLFEGI